MTYRQAKAAFQDSMQQHLGEPKFKQLAKADKPQVGQAWHQFIDDLHRAGRITTSQAQTWGNPYNP